MSYDLDQVRDELLLAGLARAERTCAGLDDLRLRHADARAAWLEACALRDAIGAELVRRIVDELA